MIGTILRTFWAQKQPNRTSLIFWIAIAVQAVPKFAKDKDVFINDPGYITNILSPKWAKSEESFMYFCGTAQLAIDRRTGCTKFCKRPGCIYKWSGLYCEHFEPKKSQIGGAVAAATAPTFRFGIASRTKSYHLGILYLGYVPCSHSK